MRHYKLIPQAEKDLIEIWSYTADKWGKAQADRYLHQLDACFEKIAQRKMAEKQPLPSYKKLKSVRCEHHYVFISDRQKTRDSSRAP
jgi:toxin ParE1/3/4